MFNAFLNTKGFKFLVSIVASVVMAYTPDNVDTVIEAVLPLLGAVDLYDHNKNKRR